MTASLIVHDVHYAYPDGHVALRGVNLRIERGERVALLDGTLRAGPRPDGGFVLDVRLPVS